MHLEKKKDDDLARGEFEAAHPGCMGSRDIIYVGASKGVGRIYQQTFVDTCSKWAAAKLYTSKTPITSADMPNGEELHVDLDVWLDNDNNERTHQGKMCCVRTPVATMLDGKTIWDQRVESLN